VKIKKFNQTIHDACDPLARKVVSNWMSQQCGMDCFPNDDKYGVDLLIKRENKVIGYIEVETRDWLQEDTKCPYKTIHVPERKHKLLNNNLITLFFAVTRDFKNAYWCKSDQILSSPLKEIPNKAINEGEYFYDVPIEKFFYIDLNFLRKVNNENNTI